MLTLCLCVVAKFQTLKFASSCFQEEAARWALKGARSTAIRNRQRRFTSNANLRGLTALTSRTAARLSEARSTTFRTRLRTSDIRKSQSRTTGSGLKVLRTSLNACRPQSRTPSRLRSTHPATEVFKRRKD
jgi:hypothetical protein